MCFINRFEPALRICWRVVHWHLDKIITNAITHDKKQQYNRQFITTASPQFVAGEAFIYTLLQVQDYCYITRC